VQYSGPFARIRLASILDPSTFTPPAASTRSTRAAAIRRHPGRHPEGRRRPDRLQHTEGTQSIADSRAIRALTLSSRIPYYTTAAGARAAALAMQNRLEGDLRVRSLQG
jgi:hypothetical protein